MTARMIPLILFVGSVCAYFLAQAYFRSPGYLARVERLKAENAIAVETKRWQAQMAREDWEKARARMSAEADANPESPLRRVV